MPHAIDGSVAPHAAQWLWVRGFKVLGFTVLGSGLWYFFKGLIELYIQTLYETLYIQKNIYTYTYTSLSIHLYFSKGLIIELCMFCGKGL